MTVKKYCPKCKAERTVDIADVISKGKKRVLCGKCSSVLIPEGELENLYWRFYGSDC